MNKQQTKAMQSFIDKLCDHLPMQRIKVLIDNGFDQWETISYLKGQELIQLGFDTQQCIVIMVAANSNALENEQQEIFSEERMQQVMAKAKENDQAKQEDILREQTQIKKKQNKPNDHLQPKQGSIKSVPSSQNIKIKQYPHKQITQALILKGTSMKPKQGQKINISKITMLTLQQKQITHITSLQKCPNIVNLHLENNYIYKIQNIQTLTKIKVLKLQHNNISRIQNLQTLTNLQLLYLSSNYIERLENLEHNTKLHQLYISKQKINSNFTFDQNTTQTLSYTLEKLQCNQNKVKNITNLRYLTVVKQVYLAKNELQDIGELSATISGMQCLKILTFKQNPITKSQKYRDYIVILSKTLEELDGKKILAKQREYLVKLYALKHAKQTKQDQKPNQGPKKEDKNINLKGVRYEEQQYGNVNLNINRATDLRGNAPHTNTKVMKR